MGKKNFRNRILDLILVFIPIYFSQDSIIFGTNISNVAFIIKNIVLVFYFFVLIVIILRKHIRIKEQSFYILMILVLISFMTMLINYDLSFKYIYISLLTISTFLMTNIISFEKIRDAYIKTMSFLAIFSIVTYIISLFNYSLITKMPQIINESGYYFYCLGFSVIQKKMEYVANRNYGIFREPGVYAIFLCIALLFTLYKENNNKNTKISIIIYMCTILTTLSTGGIIAMLLMITNHLIFTKTKDRKSNVYVFLMIVIVVVIITSPYIYRQIFGKFMVANSSYNSRFGSIITNIYIWKENIKKVIMGTGFSYVEENFKIVSATLNISTGDNTNTLLKILAVYGINYFSIIMLMLYSLSKKMSKNAICSTVIFIIIIILFSYEDLIYSNLLYMLAFLGLMNKNEKIIN